jgi:hypothetical protein
MINEKLKTLLECYLTLSHDQSKIAQSMINLPSEDFERKKIEYDNLSKNKKNLIACIGDQLEKMTKLEK